MSESLVPGGHGRRTMVDIDRMLSPEAIFDKIVEKDWEYKSRPAFYTTRDNALCALLYLTSGRINEVLRLKKDQIIPYAEDPDFMIVDQFWVRARPPPSPLSRGQ